VFLHPTFLPSTSSALHQPEKGCINGEMVVAEPFVGFVKVLSKFFKTVALRHSPGIVLI
jgi:hypothetical protein